MNQTAMRHDTGDHRETGLRPLPCNIDAERALIGSILTSPKILDSVSDFLRSAHFYDPVNGLLFETIVKLSAAGTSISPITVKDAVAGHAGYEQAGGMKYLVGLASSVVTLIGAADYGRRVFDLYRRRQLIEIGSQLVHDAYDVQIGDSAEAVATSAETSLFALADAGQSDGGFREIGSFAQGAIADFEVAYKHRGTTPGIPTGLTDLDRKLGGLRERLLYVIGGRPGMGKTSLLTTMLFNVAEHFKTTKRPEHAGKAVGIFSLEMGGEELAGRIVCWRAGLAYEDATMGKLQNDDFHKLAVARAELESLPIYIDDTPAVSIEVMFSRARRLKRQKNLGMVAVDYLQLVDTEEEAQNRVLQVGAVTRGGKKIAKALRLPVVMLAQLSRQVEQRDDKRPQMTDLREAGNIEQDADVVGFLYRHQYYLERQEPRRDGEERDEDFVNRHGAWEKALEDSLNKAEFIVAKNRHGKTGTVELYWNAEQMAFSDLFHEQPTATTDQSRMDLQ